MGMGFAEQTGLSRALKNSVTMCYPVRKNITNMDKNEQYCIDILPKVSRTFAPTIQRLPRELFLQVTVAYLLCRVADTIEDSSFLDIEQKQGILKAYADILARKYTARALDSFMIRVSSLPQKGPDYDLVHHLPTILVVYNDFPEKVRSGISTWVVEMVSGMRRYAQAKTNTSQNFLKTWTELDEYIYYVAGTVGNLITTLFSYYSHHITRTIANRLKRYAESVGKGLQMVNIIRDMPDDWKCNRSYMPSELLEKYDLTRQSIFERKNVQRSKKMLDELIESAVAYLDAAVQYIVAIPKAERSIRLSCLLPLFWALQTLRSIKKNINTFLKKEKIKISRTILREELYLAYLNVFSNRLIRRRYFKFREEIIKSTFSCS
jgi:farnesyl-diphosphate farnesyltransferase